MKTLPILAAFAALSSSAAAQIRVGTFEKVSVVVAYYRSPAYAERLKSAHAERDAARTAGDSKKVEELEAWGGKQQELAHRQLAGEAPIDNVLEALAPALPGIAQAANVAAIAPDLPYANPMVQKVDVTGQILDYLKADEATRKIVQQMRGRPAAHVHR
jgi:hypothetical protein